MWLEWYKRPPDVQRQYGSHLSKAIQVVVLQQQQQQQQQQQHHPE
jgi:hypothetical protein